jgi:hypothetical protein
MFGYPAESKTPEFPAALTVASRVYLQNGEPDRAETFAAAALRIAESVARDPTQSADVGEALQALAAAQAARGERGAARGSAQRAAQALTNSLGAGHLLTRQALDLARQK